MKITRFYHQNDSSGVEIEVILKELKVVVLPYLEDWNKSTITSPKSIYMRKHDKFRTLLERLQKILNSSGKFSLSQDTMRVWKLAPNANIEKVNHDI